MSSPLSVAYPNCETNLKVPAELAGKTIKCKGCQTAFKVPAAAKALPADLAKPAKPEPVAPPPAAPIGFADDDETAGSFGIIHDDSHIARCPRCVAVLEPPDTKICLNCGYDLLARIRHGSKKVYALTFGDYFKHLAPGVLAFLFGSAVLGGAIFCWIRMRGWLSETALKRDDKNAITNQDQYYVEPLCFNLFLGLIAVFVFYKMTRFAIKRLFLDWRPAETIKKD